MGDKRLNELLKWGIQNSESSMNDATAAPPSTNLTPEILSALMGGPSDADLMKAAIEVISSSDPEISLDDKLVAFDNFEQLIENLDNANNIASLSLWTPLVEQLSNEEPSLRKMAAWCIGTAVQNNIKTQERLLAVGGLRRLVELALSAGEPTDVRRKAVYALSSAGRNYQPAMDFITDELNKQGHPADKVDSTDMDSVDKVIDPLREKAKEA